MLCSKFKRILLSKSLLQNNVQYRYLLSSNFVFNKWVYIDGLLASLAKRNNSSGMSSLRIILKDFRLWSNWTRSRIVNSVVKRCKTDRRIRDVIQCFRQAFFRPRRTLLLSATAAYKVNGDSEEPLPTCERNILDLELQALLTELERVETLSRKTLFCAQCGNRLVIDKKHPGVRYCSCKDAVIPAESLDGWVPYMEAEDVIIWRKEYKPGQGLYAYKVYGCYAEVRASDFAAVQVDGEYRRVWDAAVASLSVVESSANGLVDQAILHWEVLWPRLFANRDYVYIRRHKEYDITDKRSPHKDAIFRQKKIETIVPYTERENVHSNAKRKSMEAYELEEGGRSENKVYVILSRSCEHPQVPETKNAIRVTEYWSHMVVKTLDGPDKAGMEFVLTYYDEPAVGGMPSSVATWATGRAAPAYLQRMRQAASHYRAWRQMQDEQELLDPAPVVSAPVSNEEENRIIALTEQDMEISNQGPEMESCKAPTREQSTQTDQEYPVTQTEVEVTQTLTVEKVDKAVSTDTPRNESKKESPPPSDVEDKDEGEESATNGSWWRYLYPFYYFV